MTNELIIIGKGPAGISAALYAARAGIQTLILAKAGSALQKAERIENYYGLPAPLTGAELMENGIQQARALGVEVLEAEVFGIGFEDTLTVQTSQGDFAASRIILATGASRKTPPIAGLSDFEGKGISYCATCDAFFYRGQDVAVIGAREYALSEAKELLETANSVTMLTNGDEPIAGIPEAIRVIPQKVKAFRGEDTLRGVELENGETLAVSGVFIAIGVAGSAELARKIGAQINKQRIVVNERMETGIPGLYAAGDCTGGFLQVAKAVYEGAVAGSEAAKSIRAQRNTHSV